jgi:hypothetical protein
MTDKELYIVKGGVNASSLNAVARIVNAVLSIGLMIGSAIKSKLKGQSNSCSM